MRRWFVFANFNFEGDGVLRIVFFEPCDDARGDAGFGAVIFSGKVWEHSSDRPFSHSVGGCGVFYLATMRQKILTNKCLRLRGFHYPPNPFVLPRSLIFPLTQKSLFCFVKPLY